MGTTGLKKDASESVLRCLGVLLAEVLPCMGANSCDSF